MVKKLRARYVFAAAVILLAAALIRIYSLDQESLWMDEAFSVWAATQNTLTATTHAAVNDVHPPFYFILLNGWTILAGSSEFAGRILSVGFGLLTLAFIYRTTHEMFSPTGGLLAALVAAVSSYQVYYARELRMYTLLPMLGAAAIFFYRRWLSGKSTGSALGFWASMTLALYTHYFGVFIPLVIMVHYWFAGASAAAAGIREQRRKLPGFILIYLGMLVAFAPWLLVLAMQTIARPGGLDQAIPTSANLMHHLLAIFTDSQPLLYAGLITVALFTVRRRPLGEQVVQLSRKKGTGVRIKPERQATTQPLSWITLLALWAALPLILTLYVNQFVPIFTVQNVTLAAPPVAMLTGVGLSRLKQGVPRRVFVILIVLAGLATNYDLYPQKPDWRRFVAHIAEQHQPGDVTFLHIGGPSLWSMPFEYYYTRQISDAAPPIDLFSIQGPPSAQVFADRLESLTGSGRPWVIFTHTTPFTDYALPLFQKMGSDKPRVPLLVDTLNDHRAYLYMSGAEPEFYFQTPGGARFRLTGYEIAPGPFHPGDVIEIKLTWEVDESSEANYSMGVYLITENAGPAADHLGFPGGDRTDEWQSGQSYPDPHQVILPGDLPPGYYNVTLQVRNVFQPDSEPLRVTDRHGTPLGDYLVLDGIMLQEAP